MIPRSALVLVMFLLLAGCTTGDEADNTSSSATATTHSTTTTVVAVPELVEAGRLVVLGSDGNVAVVEPDGSASRQVTSDAGDVVYGQPIWSPDSTALAFSQISEEGAAVRIDDVDGGSSAIVPMSSLPFYMNWSPDGEAIGVLHNGVEGLDFQVVDVSEGTSSLVDRGTPFYFSWSPDSSSVVIHEGADRFQALALDGSDEDLGDTDPGYLVPQWLSSGVLHISDGMLVIDEGENRTQLAGVDEQTFFVANDQGTRVAVLSLGEASGLSVAAGESTPVTPNTVSVVDIATGEVDVVDRSPAIGFWWSPDGESLLMLTPTGDGQEVVTKVWTAGGSLVDYSSYDLSPLLVRDLIPFFPQYAQSMTFWAPDSSGFAMAGAIDGEVGVWVQSLGAAEPRLVADGLWVAWSR